MKTKYYIVLIIIAIVAHFVLSSIAIGCGFFRGSFSYALGYCLGTPYMWLMAIGITLLLRPIVYEHTVEEDFDLENIIYEEDLNEDEENEEGKFNSTTGLFVIFIGFMWFLMSRVVPSLMY